MSIIEHLARQPGVVGCANLGGGAYRVDLEDGASRPATADEIKSATVADVVGRIKADRDRRRVAGCPVGAHIFHSDDSSRVQQIGLVMLGANIPAGLKWKTVGGSLVDMTPTLAGQIFGAQAARDAALFAHAEGLIASVQAAADPAAVDITAGWPA